MAGTVACSADLAVPSRARHDLRAPDLFRKEPFGAFRYARRDCSFTAIPAERARILAGAAECPIAFSYAREGGVPGLDDRGFAEQVVRWQHDGLLTQDGRLAARVVDGDRSHGGLSAPLVTHLELTSACNLRCSHCYVELEARPRAAQLSTAELLAVFAELESLGAPLVVLAGGEPCLRADLFEVLEGLGRHQLDGWLCTNATLVDQAMARRLAASPLRGFSVSLDGPDAATHDALRGRGQFERAVRGIGLLVEGGADDVKVRVTVNPHNVDRLLDFAALAKRLGVHKVVLKPFSLLAKAGARGELDLPRARFQQALDRVGLSWPEDACPVELTDGVPTRAPDWTRISPRFGCIAGTSVATVTADGRVVGCGCLLREDDWDVREHGFAACWREAPGITYWRRLAPGNVCSGCPKLSTCAGACRARALAAAGRAGDPDPWMGCSPVEG